MSNDSDDNEIKTSRAAVAAFYQDSMWFRFHKSLLRVMSGDEAILLSAILNVYGMEGGNWKRMSVDKLEKETYMDKRKQGRVIRMLEEKGFLQSRFEGDGKEAGAKRYIALNWDKLSKTLKDYVVQISDSTKSCTIMLHGVVHDSTKSCTIATPLAPSRVRAYAKEISEKKHTHAAPKHAAVGVFDSEPPFELRVTKHLSEIISKNLQINVPANSGQAKYIHDLIAFKGISKDRISRVLEWYENNCGDKYVPVIGSIRDFKLKFVNLEQAMLRAEGPANNVIPPAVVKIYDALVESEDMPASLIPKLNSVLVPTYNLVKPWYDKLSVLVERCAKLGSFGKIIDDIEKTLFPTGLRGFLIGYMEENIIRLSQWDDWNGEIKHLTLDTNSKWEKHARRTLSEEGYSESTIDELFQAIKTLNK